MSFEFGLAVTAVSMLFFYFRLAMLRGKKRRLAREEALKVKSAGKGAKAKPLQPNRPSYEIVSWWLVAAAAILMLVGLAARQSDFFPQIVRDYWWVGTAGGTLLFAFCFK
jgi:hypothetical protein